MPFSNKNIILPPTSTERHDSYQLSGQRPATGTVTLETGLGGAWMRTLCHTAPANEKPDARPWLWRLPTKSIEFRFLSEKWARVWGREGERAWPPCQRKLAAGRELAGRWERFVPSASVGSVL